MSFTVLLFIAVCDFCVVYILCPFFIVTVTDFIFASNSQRIFFSSLFCPDTTLSLRTIYMFKFQENIHHEQQWALIIWMMLLHSFSLYFFLRFLFFCIFFFHPSHHYLIASNLRVFQRKLSLCGGLTNNRMKEGCGKWVKWGKNTFQGFHYMRITRENNKHNLSHQKWQFQRENCQTILYPHHCLLISSILNAFLFTFDSL